jgi:hypothetical protein
MARKKLNKKVAIIGFIVFITGTSYMAITDDKGNFTYHGASGNKEIWLCDSCDNEIITSGEPDY